MVIAVVNKEKFTYLISHPEELTSAQTTAVGEIITHYPYFQSARALYLKGLKAKESFKYNQELKVTAAHTNDRSILFDFITSEAFNQNEISELIKKNTEDFAEVQEEKDNNNNNNTSENKSIRIDEELKQHLKDLEGVLDPGLFEKKEVFPPSISTSENSIVTTEGTSETILSPEEQLNIGKPLNFEKHENRSFSEWLKITSFKPIERSDNPIERNISPTNEDSDQSSQEGNALTKKFDLIDKFISSNPKISPVKEIKPTINLAQTQLVQNDSFMTETLARIYLEQKNYQKAIQSYRILILKYPEKSSFFADQIKAVEQLQANNTK